MRERGKMLNDMLDKNNLNRYFNKIQCKVNTTYNIKESSFEALIYWICFSHIFANRAGSKVALSTISAIKIDHLEDGGR